MSHGALTVFGPYPDQVFPVATRLPGTPGGPAIEITHVGHQFPPLAGKQVNHVDPLAGALQHGSHRGEEVDMGIGRDPAVLAPGEYLFDLDSDLIRLRGDFDD